MPESIEIVPLEVLKDAKAELDPSDGEDSIGRFYGAMCILLEGFLDVAIEATEEENDRE